MLWLARLLYLYCYFFFGVSLGKQVRILFCFNFVGFFLTYFIFIFCLVFVGSFNFPYLRMQLKEKTSFVRTFSFILFEKCAFNHLQFANWLHRDALSEEAYFYVELEQIRDEINKL